MLPPADDPKQGTPTNLHSHDRMMWPEMRARIDTIGCFMFEEIQMLGANPLEALAAATASTAKGLSAILDEAAEFSKKRFEARCAWGENLLRARKLEEIVELQSDFARTAYADFIAGTTKIGTLYSDLAKEAFKQAKIALPADTLAGAE
jgi:hypothetical protein